MRTAFHQYLHNTHDYLIMSTFIVPTRVELSMALRDVSRVKNISARRYARGVLTARNAVELRRDA